jgi:hypothetical protein
VGGSERPHDTMPHCDAPRPGQAGWNDERSNITVREPWARLDFARVPGTEAIMPAYLLTK